MHTFTCSSSFNKHSPLVYKRSHQLDRELILDNVCIKYLAIQWDANTKCLKQLSTSPSRL
jgi:hypothetical protein